jgi:copper homeostasis protein
MDEPATIRTLAAALLDYGIRAFHVGSAVRSSWSDPVEWRLVRQWRALVERD